MGPRSYTINSDTCGKEKWEIFPNVSNWWDNGSQLRFFEK